MKNILLVFLVLLTIVFGAGLGYLIKVENTYIPPTQSEFKLLADKVSFSNKFIREKRLSDISTNSDAVYNGWIPQWAMDSGITSFEKNKSKFGTISPVFYGMEPDGKLTANTKGLDRIKEVIRGTDVKLVPTISSFGADALGANLRSPDVINKFLIDEVEKNGYDGIDLNYESTYLADKQAFFNHLQYLSTELKKRNKFFSVTVLSKWGDLINYGFSPQTRQVQDYAEIAKYADQIRIMTYDYTSQGSANPGPVAPIDWVEQVLQYATNRVDPKKIAIGIPLYGYFWNATEEKAKALDFRQIMEIKNLNSNPDDFYSEKHEEAAIKYIGAGNKAYFGYYSSPESIQARIDLAKKYGVTNTAFWRLGNDPL
jgi:spore germination protein YaaH